MSEPDARRPWWRKKRWIAALLFCLASAYPLSFVLGCWVTMRLHPRDHQREYALFGEAFRPIAVALIESPHPIRNCVYRTVELGAAEGATFLRDYDHGVVWAGRDDTCTLLWYRR